MANPLQMVMDTIERMGENKLERCYGINAAANNDSAEGAHSYAGQATQGVQSQVVGASAGRRLRQDPEQQDHRELRTAKLIMPRT